MIICPKCKGQGKDIRPIKIKGEKGNYSFSTLLICLICKNPWSYIVMGIKVKGEDIRMACKEWIKQEDLIGIIE